MKMLKKIIEAITYPFIAVAVMVDESRRINEDGSWDRYNERKNRREMKKAERREKRGKEEEEKMNEIREIRKRAGMTQEQFGELLGIPRRTIQNWEGGQRKCPDYVISLIRYRMEKEESKR